MYSISDYTEYDSNPIATGTVVLMWTRSNGYHFTPFTETSTLADVVAVPK